MSDKEQAKESQNDIIDLINEIARGDESFKVACHNIVMLTDQNQKLKAAINTALILVEQAFGDMRHANATPTATLMIAKGNFDAQMKKLLGEDWIETRRTRTVLSHD
jgi:hypothetical protein